MKAAIRVGGVMLLGVLLMLGCSSAADGRTPLGKAELIKVAPKPGLASLPADAPQPVLYYLNKANVPSCGLLPSGAAMITPMLETEPDQNFPSCEEVTDGAAFVFGGATGYVFRYRQRDTREDRSTVYFFVQRSGGELRPLDKLNNDSPPENKSIRAVAAWAKSKLVSQDNDKDAYQTSTSDSIVTDSAFLNVSRNAATGSCRIVVDLVATQGSLGPVTTPCQTVVASTSLIANKATYFIVLTESGDHRPRGQIFVVQGNTVRETTELEERLASEIGSGKILKVKESLRPMVESR